MRRHEIDDEQWSRIEGLLSGKAGDPGVTARDNRLFVNAVLWVARTGSPWADLPERFGKSNSVWRRFDRWARRGVWSHILRELSDPDLEALILDSTIVRAHPCAAGAEKKPTAAGGKTSKRWADRAADSAASCTWPSTPVARPWNSI
jgi:transposase